mmetsp:Transcript_30981/g.65802  ORF Transcript_30981/g.65802 Transcript_30981/m.65802 type:complete len:201 (-) Transcript_30981:100-702(-)
MELLRLGLGLLFLLKVISSTRFISSRRRRHDGSLHRTLVPTAATCPSQHTGHGTLNQRNQLLFIPTLGMVQLQTFRHQSQFRYTACPKRSTKILAFVVNDTAPGAAVGRCVFLREARRGCISKLLPLAGKLRTTLIGIFTRSGTTSIRSSFLGPILMNAHQPLKLNGDQIHGILMSLTRLYPHQIHPMRKMHEFLQRHLG